MQQLLHLFTLLTSARCWGLLAQPLGLAFEGQRLVTHFVFQHVSSCACHVNVEHGTVPLRPSACGTRKTQWDFAAGVQCRTFEYTFVSYFLLPTALMRVPVLGSLVAFPGAAMGAYALKDILSRKAGLREALEHLN